MQQLLINQLHGMSRCIKSVTTLSYITEAASPLFCARITSHLVWTSSESGEEIGSTLTIHRLCCTISLMLISAEESRFWNCNFFILFVCLSADTKSIVEHTHSADRRLIKTDKTERSTRHWSRRNHRVTDTFCNCIEDRTIGLQTHS